MIEGAIVADLRGLADHHAHAVVDEHPSADGSAGVDLDAGEEARDVRNEPSQPLETGQPEHVGETVEGKSVEARIAGEHLPHRSCGGVAVEDAADVFAGSLEHGSAFFLRGNRRNLLFPE